MAVVKSRTIYIVAAVIVAMLLAAFVLIPDSRDDNQANNGGYMLEDATTGLSINYNPELNAETNEQALGGVLFTLTKADPRIQVTAWTEEEQSVESLKQSGEPLNAAMVDSLKIQINQLDDVFPEAVITNAELTNTNGFKSGEVVFDYKSAGLATTQRRLILIKDDSTIVTIAMQSLKEDYENVNQDYFNEIVDSATFQ